MAGVKGDRVSKRKPRVEAAVIWFEGYGPDSQFFRSAFDAGAFIAREGYAGGFVEDREPRAWPAAVELTPLPDDRDQQFTYYGRRLGIDVTRRCVVVELGDAEGAGRATRVVVNLDAVGAVLEIGRAATGQT